MLEQQKETDTCGLHALSTVYRAYGLDAERERLRWRLGIDTKAVLWKSDTTGALHPDMAMVLAQDHFAVESINPSLEPSWSALKTHVRSGHPAVLLITRRENEALHWVVVAEGLQVNQVLVYDPLFEEPYFEDRNFWDNHVITAWGIQPAEKSREISSWRAHRNGVQDLAQATKRILELGKR